jgi:hypothetical protein
MNYVLKCENFIDILVFLIKVQHVNNEYARLVFSLFFDLLND